MDDDVYVARMHAFYQALRPHAVVQRLVDEQAYHLTPATVGVHVRQSDTYGYFLSGIIPVELFAREMEGALRQCPETTFLVCSEDPDARAFLQARFGERILPRTVGTEADDRYSVFGQ
jgi:hypothetical protein